MKKIKWLLISTLLILISVLALMYFNREEPPIFEEINNVKSETYNFVKQYLIKGNIKYVTDSTEFPLEITGGSYGKQIGRTASRNKVLKIKGQDPRDYVILTGFMTPTLIYRNVSIPPVDFYSTQIGEIQLRDNKGSLTILKKTTDRKIISEAQECLRKPTYLPIKGEAELIHISLISPMLNGLSYMIYVAIDQDKNVYLEDFIKQKPMKTGPLFTQWVNE